MTKLTDERLRHQLHAIADWTGPIDVPAVPTPLPTPMSAPPRAHLHVGRVLLVAAALTALLAAVVVLRTDGARRSDPASETAARIRRSAQALATYGPLYTTVMPAGVPHWDASSLGGAMVAGSYDFATRTGTLADVRVPGFTELRVVGGEIFVWVPAWEQKSLADGTWVRVSPDDLRSASPDVRSVAAALLMRDPGTIADLLTATKSATDSPRGYGDALTQHEATLDVAKLRGAARLLGEFVGQPPEQGGDALRHTISVSLDSDGRIRVVELFFQRTPLGYTALREGDYVKLLIQQVGAVPLAEAEAPEHTESITELLVRRPFLQRDHSVDSADKSAGSPS